MAGYPAMECAFAQRESGKLAYCLGNRWVGVATNLEGGREFFDLVVEET